MDRVDFIRRFEHVHYDEEILICHDQVKPPTSPLSHIHERCCEELLESMPNQVYNYSLGKTTAVSSFNANPEIAIVDPLRNMDHG